VSESFLGLDVGSTSTKAVLLSRDAEVLALFYRKTSGDPIRATQRLFSAVRELELVLAEHRDRLDTATVRVIEESLATIDRAIAEAVAALGEDPANPYLTGHLATAMRRKLDVLQQAAALAATSS